MSIKDEVLQFLTLYKGQSVSGERIAKALYVSRNAVWRAVRSLRDEGHRIHAATNRGYLLDDADELLSGASVHARLQESGGFYRVDVKNSVSSTNSAVKAMAERGEDEGYVLLARGQTGGRGRRGRTFYSPPGSGLYISVLLRPRMKAEEVLSVTTAAAVAVCRAVEEVFNTELSIKWVNDLFLCGRKVCGILTEAAFDGETGGLSNAVLGIGLNLCEPADGFPEELSGVAGALLSDKHVSDGRQAEIAAAILESFYQIYRRLPDMSYIDEYRARSCLIGERVAVCASGAAPYPVTVLAIDENARLVVRRDDGTQERIGAGEVSLLYTPARAAQRHFEDEHGL